MSAPLELIKAQTLSFTRVECPLSGDDLLYVRARWRDLLEKRPYLFNGEIAALSRISSGAECDCAVDWFTTEYAHYILRDLPGTRLQPARAVFVSVVLITKAGAVVVGEMGPSTAAPGQLQLPGGNVLPRANLTLESCRNEAIREVREEVGVSLASTDLSLWRVKTGGTYGDLGLIFLCKVPIGDEDLMLAFGRSSARISGRGDLPELSAIHFIRNPQELSQNTADYLIATTQALDEERKRKEPQCLT